MITSLEQFPERDDQFLRDEFFSADAHEMFNNECQGHDRHQDDQVAYDPTGLYCPP